MALHMMYQLLEKSILSQLHFNHVIKCTVFIASPTLASCIVVARLSIHHVIRASTPASLGSEGTKKNRQN
jgi:hypothetical protein